MAPDLSTFLPQGGYRWVCFRLTCQAPVDSRKREVEWARRECTSGSPCWRGAGWYCRGIRSRRKMCGKCRIACTWPLPSQSLPRIKAPAMSGANWPHGVLRPLSPTRRFVRVSAALFCRRGRAALLQWPSRREKLRAFASICGAQPAPSQLLE
jgi:hypothetical protein